MNCYIIDDEFHAIEVLERYIQRTPGLVLAGSATNPLAALNRVSETQDPMVIFLDIDMPEMNGLEVAGMLNPYHTIIFTTSFKEYALDAFEKHAAGYLLKPISYERFAACIQKLRTKALTGMAAETSIFVQTETRGKFVRIGLPDISYVSGLQNYIEIYHAGGKTVTYLTLNEMMDKLPQKDFSRIHQSHLIAHAALRIVEPGQVTLHNNVKLPVGRAYKEALQRRLAPEMLISKRKKTD